MTYAMSRPVRYGCLLGILMLAAGLRLTGLDWDEGQHLHPDERFLCMVEHDLRWPGSLPEYWDQAHSGLNPRNVGHAFFVYGTFPTTLVKGLALLAGSDGHDRARLVGRLVSALLDLGTVGLTFLLARWIYRDDRTALLAALFMAVAVLAIQLAHFFTTDSFAAFFLMLALYALARVQRCGRLWDYAWCGLALGIACACKISSLLFVAMPVLIVAGHVRERWSEAGFLRRSLRSLAGLTLLLLLALLAFRVAQPDAFDGPGFWGMRPCRRWLDNLAEIRRLMSGERDFPPSHQWAGRTILWHPWVNMMLWGMGLPLGTTAWLGFFFAGRRLAGGGDTQHLIPVAWTGLVFLYFGTRFIMPMRYMLPLYPTLAVLAAWLLVRAWERARGSATARRWAACGLGAAVAGTLLWALAFTSIYTRPHSRIEASRWLYAHIPAGSRIACEGWDDALPLPIDGRNPYPDLYTGLQLDWYSEDTPEKLQLMLDRLQAADYLVLGSNRLYGSIPRLPMRYPLTVRYYRGLFDGSLGFEKIADFTARPRLLGMEIVDDNAEEPFTVYDHPRVQVFRRTAAFDRERAARMLGEVDWDGILRLLPRQVSEAPTALLLSPERRRAQRDAGTWSELFPPDSLANRAPLVAWMLLLQLLGWVGAPYLFVACRNLPDRGYAFSKILGMLLPAWLAYVLAGFQLAPFNRIGIQCVLAAWGAGAYLLAHRHRAEIRSFWQDHRSIILASEALFWALFLVGVGLRYCNPDLWHPWRGGEKPMDLAYLSAVVKSDSFPPYDPWFAGGWLNYYYFGYVMWGTLIKLVGIAPPVAYNLAIPSLLAMAGTGAFGVASAIVSGREGERPRHGVAYSLLGPLFLVVVGNLGAARLLVGRLIHSTPAPPEAWYWNASRVIAHPPAEAGPITEFPCFTFLFGDLHAHAMALPLMLLGLGLLAALVRGSGALLLGLLALVLGAVGATHAWDAPTLAALILLALWYGRRLHGRPASTAWLWLALLAAAYLLFLPFHRHFANAYMGAGLWRGSRTNLGDYLTVHGFFLFVIVSAVVADFWFGSEHNGVARVLRMGLRHMNRLRRLVHLHRRWVHPGPGYGLGLAAVLAALAGGVMLALWRQGAPALVILLLIPTLLCLFRRVGHPRRQIGLGMAAVGLLATLLVEFVVVKGDVARMNTVFRFYYQAWLLLALASVESLVLLAEQRVRWPVGVRRSWSAMLALLFCAALLYPVMAIPARLADRFPGCTRRTLDGSAFMQDAVLDVRGQPVPLHDDREAIAWLQQRVHGSPVLVEANTFPELYTWGGRYSMFTGLPSVVGWNWHQRQQRAVLPQVLVDQRTWDVEKLYSTTDLALARRILARYDVQYVIVGTLERLTYPAEGIEKFDSAQGTLGTLVHDNGGVQIYRISH